MRLGTKGQVSALLKSIIGGFVGLLVGTAFISPIAVQVYTASQDGNLSSTDQTVVTFVTTMFIIALMMVAVNMI